MSELVDKLRRGDRRTLARAMSQVDSSGRADPELEALLRKSTGDIPWWGFTGPPGVGKSTLIDALLVRLREQGRRIGVVAVDPSSPRSNGALLGDRVRMMRHACDDDVFIRSLATHRHKGALSEATLHCARLLELAGYDPVLIETVGVGQNEVEIGLIADLSVVVLGPGHGDEVQLTKAGLLEIADVVVVNKCDLPESRRLLNEVRAELSGAARIEGSDGIDIVGVEAKSGRDVEVLLDRLLDLDRTRRKAESPASRSERRMLGEIQRRAEHACAQALTRSLAGSAAKDWIAGLNRGELSLDHVISQLATSALAELPGQEGDETKTEE